MHTLRITSQQIASTALAAELKLNCYCTNNVAFNAIQFKIEALLIADHEFCILFLLSSLEVAHGSQD